MVDASSNFSEGKALAVSVAIAELLCRCRLKYNAQSTWLGTTQYRDASGTTRFTHGTMGPSLYGGVSGIALFLAEASVRTGTQQFGDVAVSAILHALSRADAIPARTRLGFFSGLPGLAYTASRVGYLLDRPVLVRRGRSILRRLARESSAGTILDVISGAAGSAPIIARLAQDWNDEALRLFAKRLGFRLVARAHKTVGGWSWGATATGFDTARHLTGFAHGAAGFGWSLFELHCRLGVPQFARGAREAFRYERRWFRKDQANWPDFRETRSARRAPCRLAWCHGAPGIGMSRLAATSTHGESRYLADLRAALRSSQVALQNHGDLVDYTLCHGTFGIAEFVLMAAQVIGDKTAEDTALSFASVAADAYADRPEAWPCGLDRGVNASLMLGLAGIGYFYLRLADRGVPAVLLPGSLSDSASQTRQRAANRLRPERAESTTH